MNKNKIYKGTAVVIGAATIFGIGVSAGAGTASTKTVTKVVTKPVPGPMRTVNVPGPTKTVIAAPPVLTRKTFSGSGNWNSPSFNLGCGSGTPVVTAKYSFSGNSFAGDGGDNFAATLEETGNGDMQMITNTIAASGGDTTTLYPSPMNTGNYYLSVNATGNWSFDLSETCQ